MPKTFVLTCIVTLSLCTSCKNFGPIIICNSIPKSGTFLLGKVLRLLTNRKKLRHFPVMQSTESALNNINDDQHVEINHIIYSAKNNQAFRKFGCKVFFIYRDPRDQLVSYAYWIVNHPKTFPWMSSLSFDNVLLSLIHNGNVYSKLKNYPWKSINNIDTFYRSFLPWIQQKHVCSVRFEDLIGEKGAGSKYVQFECIKKIANHLELYLDDNEIYQLGENLFGGTATFQSGQLGRWKTHFKKIHIDTFKKVAPQLLPDLGYNENWD